jgi:hypothetical protein
MEMRWLIEDYHEEFLVEGKRGVIEYRERVK